MKKRFIAADGGGTKLSAALYDEDLTLLGRVSTRGTNGLFRPREALLAEAEEAAAALIPPDTERIEALDCSIVGDASILADAVRKRCALGLVRTWGEGAVALASAGVRYGIAAQAGTGSDAFLIQPDRTVIVGGWGMTLGDEGGGYDIGLKTLRAAIRASDGREPPSLLTKLVMREFGLNALWDLVGRLAGDPDLRMTVASAAKICSKAALAGDEAALRIYREAGRELALDVIAAARRYGKPFEGPVIVSGGAWKGSAAMVSALRDEVCAALDVKPADVRFPAFEPLVGSVLLGQETEGGRMENLFERLRESFGAFRYALPADDSEGVEP